MLPMRVCVPASRWYECADTFHAVHRAELVSMVATPELLDPIFCHWEPAVRHLAHMLLVYRFVPPEHVYDQWGFFTSLLEVLPAVGSAESGAGDTAGLATPSGDVAVPGAPETTALHTTVTSAGAVPVEQASDGELVLRTREMYCQHKFPPGVFC
eukprot:m.1348307 g.1348307  ORF g.1348307 m.1348307 type:complete len:155 (-) comp24914_c0_seq18:752-1216(-)